MNHDDQNDALFYAGLGAVAALLLGGAYALSRGSRPARLNALEEAGVDCADIQDWLFDYLKTDIDPYDFEFMIKEWAEDVLGDELDIESYDYMTDEQKDSFVDWMKNKGVSSLLRENSLDTPAYLTLHAKRKLPTGTVLVHFTRERFDSFDRGTTIEGMHLSVYKSKEFADCQINLSKDVGLAEVVFGFALEASEAARHANSYSKKYGKNAIVFRCDCAVLAYHDGDEERQAIFPICSEYDVMPLAGDGYGGFTLGSVVDGEDVEFDSLRDALAYYEEHK